MKSPCLHPESKVETQVKFQQNLAATAANGKQLAKAKEN